MTDGQMPPDPFTAADTTYIELKTLLATATNETRRLLLQINYVIQALETTVDDIHKGDQ